MICTGCGGYLRHTPDENAAFGRDPYPYDTGYGQCRPCRQLEADYERRLMDRHIAQLADALNPENRAAFEAMDRELQEALVHEAVHDGLFTYTIRGAGSPVAA